MRVIAGKARRIQLKSMEGMNTRPTTDRIKETLFNMLSQNIYGCHFLVENNRQAVTCIRENLTKTKLMPQAEIMSVDCQTAIDRLENGKRHFDIVFMDPPYNKQLEKEMLERMQHVSFIDEGTMIIIEASLETEFDWLEAYGYEITKVKKYKTNQHVFVQRVLEK